MTEHLPECPKGGCPACHEQGQRDCALTHAIRGLKDMNRIAARGYDDGQRDAIAAAVQRIEALPWTSETWLAHAERAAIIAAIKGDQQ